MTALWKQPLSPQNIVVGFCLPTTIEGYIEHVTSPDRREFVQHVLGPSEWPKALSERNKRTYKTVVIQPCDYAVEVMEHVGAKVVRDVTLRLVTEILEDPACHCALFFAHHPDSSRDVELFDGLAAFDVFIEAIPKSYEGVVDFVVCTSEEFADEIAVRRPNIGPLKGETSTRTFQSAVLICAAVIKALSETNANYYEALDGIALFINRPEEK